MTARTFRKKPVEIQASQWFDHGDHPQVREYSSSHPAYRAVLNCCQRSTAEHDATYRGMTDSGKEVFEAVKALAQHGRSEPQIVRWVTRVYGPGLPFRERTRLAWHLLRGYR